MLERVNNSHKKKKREREIINSSIRGAPEPLASNPCTNVTFSLLFNGFFRRKNTNKKNNNYIKWNIRVRELHEVQ